MKEVGLMHHSRWLVRQGDRAVTITLAWMVLAVSSCGSETGRGGGESPSSPALSPAADVAPEATSDSCRPSHSVERREFTFCATVTMQPGEKVSGQYADQFLEVLTNVVISKAARAGGKLRLREVEALVYPQMLRLWISKATSQGLIRLDQERERVVLTSKGWSRAPERLRSR
jgi:hypothetical protein